MITLGQALGAARKSAAMVFVAAALLLRSPVAAEQNAGGTAVIRGRVIAADTGQPIRGARVEVLRSASATADDGGFYEIRGLAAGTQILVARPPEYRAMYLAARRLATGEYAVVEAGEGQVVERVDFALARAGAISGRVVDEFGQPITGMVVAALQPQVRRLLPAGTSGRSDDEGRFRVYGLGPGRYVLRAEGAPASWSEELGPNGETYLRTYYPDTTRASDAVPITLSQGEDRQNTDIRVVWNRTFTVGGVITSPAGRPVAGATVVLDVPRQRLAEQRRTTSNASGRFHFLQVPPGDYALSASQSRAARGTGALASRAHRLTVAAADLLDLQIPLRASVTVSGGVVTDTGSSPPTEARRAGLRIVAGNPNGSPATSSGDVRDDWAFDLADVTGPIVIRLSNLADGWFQKTVRHRGIDVGRQPIDFVESGHPTDVVVIVSDSGATLAGSVVDAGGRGAVGRLVLLHPADVDPDEVHLVDRLWQVSDETGRFEIGTIPPGDYFAIAFDDPPGGFTVASHDPLPTTPEEDAAIATMLGTPLTLGARERKEIRLRPVARPY